jgi:hypothetical protein
MAVVGDESGTSGAGGPPPEPVKGSEESLPKRVLAEVRGWPRAILGMIVAAIIALLVAGTWAHFSGSDATGFHGFILGPTGTAVYQAPAVSSEQVGDLPANAGVVVVCTRKRGDPVVGPKRGGGTQVSRVWDKVRPDGSSKTLGFVPDALVKTGTTKPVEPAC